MEIPCLAHFARDRDKIITINASRTVLGKTLDQKTNRQHNPTDSFRQQTFEQRRVESFDWRISIFSSGMRAREFSFPLVR